MPRIHGTTNAMTTFLRAFRQSPAGPPPEQWPAPAVLRRWLRRPAFQQALVSLRHVLQFRAEFHLAAAAAQAALTLHQSAHPTPPPAQRDADAAHNAPTQDSAPGTHDPTPNTQNYKRLIDLLRLSHLRQRFPIEAPDFRIPSKYDQDGERLYTIDELDDNFEPLHPSPNIAPKIPRTRPNPPVSGCTEGAHDP